MGVKLYSNSNSNVIFHGPNLLLSYRIVCTMSISAYVVVGADSLDHRTFAVDCLASQNRRSGCPSITSTVDSRKGLMLSQAVKSVDRKHSLCLAFYGKYWNVGEWIMYEIGALRYSTADQRPHRCCPVRIKLKILTASKSRCASSKVSHPVGGEIRARSQYVVLRAAQVYTTNGSLIASAQGRI